MSSIRTLLLSAPTLDDLLHLHQYLQGVENCQADAKTRRRWEEAAFFRVAEFIREADTGPEVIAILNSTQTGAQYAAPDNWKDGIRILARRRLEELDPDGKHPL